MRLQWHISGWREAMAMATADDVLKAPPNLAELEVVKRNRVSEKEPPTPADTAGGNAAPQGATAPEAAETEQVRRQRYARCRAGRAPADVSFGALVDLFGGLGRAEIVAAAV